MDAANSTKMGHAPQAAGIGELVLQNGRQAGTRRSLGVPTTFIGRGQGCDIRLNIDGVDPMHCVLVYSQDGLIVRDLNSSHGTYVNGDPVTELPIRHGDLLKVGPFQFRVEMSATAILEQEQSNHAKDNPREAMHIQVAAVAAQQVGLEEEEMRLLQQQSHLQQQEEQLATHLAEKQRQVQMWSEHTKTERETLRKQKTEQHKLLSHWEQELNEIKEHLGEEQQRLLLERQRINKVYQRLRQRWQRQWSAEKSKYQEQFAELKAEAKALDERQQSVREHEQTVAQETLRFNTERELSTRQLQESWEELKKAQASWKRRQTHERALAKTRQQKMEATVVKLNEARQLLQQERETWQRQQDILQRELHGLNNRVVHQRQKIKEQEEKISLMDQELRTRLLHLQRVTEIESAGNRDITVSGTVSENVASTPANTAVEGTALIKPSPTIVIRDGTPHHAMLDTLAGELADQRIHLVEQYKRLAEIQELWTLQREQASQDLEALAQKLVVQEQDLAQREQEAVGAEHNLLKERKDVQALRREIQVWRTRLKSREQAVEQEHQKRLQMLRQQEMLLQEQLAGLTYLRQRWNRRRQEEIEYLRNEQAQLKQQRDEMNQLRQELFAKGQQLEEEKRIIAEKTLAIELYRQDMTHRANDPAAGRKIERLRRRWLMQNAAQIRHARHAGEMVKADMTNLEARLEEWTNYLDHLSQANAVIAEQQGALEEREALLKAREQKIEQELLQHEAQRQLAEEQYLRMKEEVERVAKEAEEEANPPTWPMEKAA